jgi:hypothetical protein
MYLIAAFYFQCLEGNTSILVLALAELREISMGFFWLANQVTFWLFRSMMASAYEPN